MILMMYHIRRTISQPIQGGGVVSNQGKLLRSNGIMVEEICDDLCLLGDNKLYFIIEDRVSSLLSACGKRLYRYNWVQCPLQSSEPERGGSIKQLLSIRSVYLSYAKCSTPVIRTLRGERRFPYQRVSKSDVESDDRAQLT